MTKAIDKMKLKAWKDFQKRKGERWLFEASHSAGLGKLRQAFYEGVDTGVDLTLC